MLSSSTLTTNECTEDDTLVMFGWVLSTFNRKDPVEEESRTMSALTGEAGSWSKYQPRYELTT